MKALLFSIRDQKAGRYGPPFAKQTRGEAEREFFTITNNEQSTINQFPADFDLWEIGELDQTNGKITPLPTPVHMMKAIDCHQPKNQSNA